MYSFQYDESEAVWPNDVGLSTFAEQSSDIVVTQIFRQLFDDVRDQMTELKNELQHEMWQLTTSINELLTAFDSYLTSAQVDETFARYVTPSRIPLNFGQKPPVSLVVQMNQPPACIRGPASIRSFTVLTP